ncbi:hypothetical protein SPRG_13924 [Saprolegnia parasitica CBS 223.65]|uniref:Centrosomin N-terminal motif 1 domain-containing protein n=1 Tax=Saprolegnia parasitica (strain CBS 223.65) TaxID=695850 RepID=A0A067BR58_SAPPC|nr:hypothetical protein SPRG_13924 [Saprolegnia parasitica CBS 223.65]KDO20713.1 hypothetical protein SPRG_13924 [Saprolegnia parasitica CBS 223.65]|eukprot:XP_012208594.1 hypothetical protein SPRG_13924 [Saprolegnia parasitica CBS 223.65]
MEASDPRGDLLLIREGEMERERLQKEAFNMKLRINFLEEQLLKYKEGTAFEDEDFESENMHLRTVIEEKVQELERRNFLLVRARDAIEVLRVDLETAKENNRLSASANHSQLEESTQEALRLEQDVARLEDELQAAYADLDALRQTNEDLMRRFNDLELEHTEKLRIVQRLESEKERTSESATWEVQRAKNELKLAHEAQLNSEKEQWHKERKQIVQNWEQKVREKEADLDRAKATIGDRDDTIKTLQQGKMELELALERTTKQREADKADILELQQRLQRATSESDDSYALRRQCDQFEADVASLKKQLDDQTRRAKDDEMRLNDEIERLRGQKQQMLDEMSVQTDKVRWETLKKLEVVEATNVTLTSDVQRATAEIQKLQEALFKAHASATEWEARASSTASEWQAKVQGLQQVQSEGAVLEREQAKMQERLSLVQAELTAAKDADRQLRGSFQLALADIAKTNLEAAIQEKRALEASLSQESAKNKQQRQLLKARIQALEAERSQIHLQSKDEAQSLAVQLGHMHGLKEHFTTKSYEMEAAWQLKSGQYQARIDMLQDRLGAATEKLAQLQAMREGSQQQRFDQLKYEAMQAKMQWEQELLQARKAIRDESDRAAKYERDARDAQTQLQRVELEFQQKFARLEIEYQRVLRDVASLQNVQSKTQPELHRKDEHIRLLKEEADQSKRVQADLTTQLRSAIQEHAQYRSRMDELQKTIGRLQEKERTTEQLVWQQCQRNEALLEKALPTNPTIEPLENLVRKTRELVEHTRRFQEKYATAWPNVLSGAQAMSGPMEHDCGRLLRANNMLCHKLAQAVAEWKRGQSQQPLNDATPALAPAATASPLTPPPSSASRQRASLSQAELEALVHTLHESKAKHGVTPLSVVPGTARILDAYQSSNSVLARLNKELLKVHNTIEGYARPPPAPLR